MSSTLSKEEILEVELKKYKKSLHGVCNGILEVKFGIEAAMDEWGKQESRKEVEGYETWKKRQGIMWNIENAPTPAEALYDLYIQSKQKQG